VSDLVALHAAVIAAPADDGPRAAYAAAVAWTDAERSELISVQLRLDAQHKAQLAIEDTSGIARASELVKKRGAEWASDVVPLVTAYRFLRGFIDDVRLDANAFLSRAGLLYQLAPVLHVELTHAHRVHGLMASPHLARLHSLDLHDNELDDDDVAQLCARPLPELRWLQLSGNHIGRAGLDALAAAAKTTMPRLAYLGFEGNAVADPIDWLDRTRFRVWPPGRDAVP
jgi:hypothetical protein